MELIENGIYSTIDKQILIINEEVRPCVYDVLVINKYLINNNDVNDWVKDNKHTKNYKIKPIHESQLEKMIDGYIGNCKFTLM